jgi:N utilization substance protein B
MSGRRKQGGRRAARRSALFLLYNWDLTGKPLTEQSDEPVDPFALELAEAVVARSEELDGRIDEVSEGWPAERLGVLERNILRIGISELEGATVPPEVAIAEAVGLAKRYATPEAAKLVNGILGRVAAERAA